MLLKLQMNNSTSVLHKIATLYAEQLMSDICLVVGNNRYPAHRVILCASSEVFQVMLMNPEWNECRESVIELKEEPCCLEVFPQFLKYLYVGQIRISLQTVMPMLALADKYNIKDLVQLCVDYMLKHISKAATQGCLVSWLHYTISFSPYHQEITDAIQRFLKWNLEIVAEARDFVDLDINILIALLQQNDLVLKNEYELFEYAENWFAMKKRQIDVEQMTDSITDEQKAQNLRDMMRSIFVHIRYAMMTPRDLAKLLLKPMIKQDAEFFVDRISNGMTYHAGQDECIQKLQKTADGSLQFTPRLYTSDTYGLSMNVSDFENVENYQRFCGCFFSQRNLSEQEELEQEGKYDFSCHVRYDSKPFLYLLRYQTKPFNGILTFIRVEFDTVKHKSLMYSICPVHWRYPKHYCVLLGLVLPANRIWNMTRDLW